MNEETYSEALVTFVDVLGFRKIVEARPFQEIRKLIGDFAHMEDTELGRLGRFHSIHFSDSVVRVIAPSNNKFADIQLCVLQECVRLKHSQYLLAEKGIWIRGGIAYGDVYAENNIVFGPAFIEAYEVESKLAIWPRIAFAPSLVQRLTVPVTGVQLLQQPKNNLTALRKHVAVADDGTWFVDYGRFPRPDGVSEELATDPDFPELVAPDRTSTNAAFFGAHKDAILELANSAKHLSHETPKLYRLASYHNECVSECVTDPILQQDLRIGSNHLPGFNVEL